VFFFTRCRSGCLDSLSMSPRAYRARGRPRRSEETRERIKTAVRDLLAEGSFHDSTVEEVADRAGVARATLYQHFRSRLELVDAVDPAAQDLVDRQRADRRSELERLVRNLSRAGRLH